MTFVKVAMTFIKATLPFWGCNELARTYMNNRQRYVLKYYTGKICSDEKCTNLLFLKYMYNYMDSLKFRCCST